MTKKVKKFNQKTKMFNKNKSSNHHYARKMSNNFIMKKITKEVTVNFSVFGVLKDRVIKILNDTFIIIIH